MSSVAIRVGSRPPYFLPDQWQKRQKTGEMAENGRKEMRVAEIKFDPSDGICMLQGVLCLDK